MAVGPISMRVIRPGRSDNRDPVDPWRSNHWHIQVVRDEGPRLLSDKFSTDEIFACEG
jgi:protocatechuate 3,4-dioxygenase beta subunit